MKKLYFAVAAFAVTASFVQAGCGPFCQGASHKGNPKPVFQAAPWYLYWPYNAHFQTPAPMMGAYYAPPAGGCTLTSPYFPAGGSQGYPGAASYPGAAPSYPAAPAYPSAAPSYPGAVPQGAYPTPATNPSVPSGPPATNAPNASTRR